MREMSGKAFLRWANAGGIGIDPRFAYDWPRDLAFQGRSSQSAYWQVPRAAQEAVRFVESILACCDAQAGAVLWPRHDNWLSIWRGGQSPVVARLARTLILPKAGAGAMRFGANDVELLVSLIFCSVALGGDSTFDLFLIPGARDLILKTDHHDAVWATCRDAKRLKRVAKAMRLSGYERPDRPPDWTFKQ